MKLTPRQKQIVQLVCEDKTLKAVGLELGISFKTVGYHLQKLYREIGLMGTAGLTKWALRHGLTTL